MKTRANMPLEDHVITGRFPVAGHFLKKAIGRLALQNIRPLNPRPAKIILLYLKIGVSTMIFKFSHPKLVILNISIYIYLNMGYFGMFWGYISRTLE